MSAPWTVHVLDSVLRLHLPPVLRERLADLLVPSPGEGEGTPHELWVDALGVRLDAGPATGAGQGPAGLLEHVLAAVNAAVIQDLRSPAVHAGAVSRGGAVLAWPGVSGAGKSTLTAACLRAGLDYVSDEALVLQGERVRAYPKPLSLDAWSSAAVGLDGPLPGSTERPVHWAELGARRAEQPLVPAHLLTLQRGPGAPTLTPTSRAATAMLLVEHSFNHFKDPVAALRATTTAARRARCWTLRYDVPGDAAQLLVELVDGSGTTS